MSPATPDLPDIVAFITARRDEDDAAARSLADRSPNGWILASAFTMPDGEFGADLLAHIVRHDPARVRRVIDAKRAVIGEQTCDHAPIESMYGTVCRTCVDWQDAPWDDGGDTEFGIAIPQKWPCRVARSEAATWSNHPDYQQEWAL